MNQYEFICSNIQFNIYLTLCIAWWADLGIKSVVAVLDFIDFSRINLIIGFADFSD